MTAAVKTTEMDWLNSLNEKFKDKVDICDFFSHSNSQHTIWVGNSVGSEQALAKFANFENFHLVQEDSVAPADSINLAAQMLTNSEYFFNNQVQLILNPEEDSSRIVDVIFDQDFCQQEEKYQMLESIEKAVVDKTNSSSLIYDIQSIADELITNAIFHATSVVADRKNEIQDGKFGNLKVAQCDEKILISCSDPHGTLQPHKLLERIYKCYTTDIAQAINQGGGGAGIGSFLVHGMSACYIIAVKENIQTTITAVLPLKMSNRKRLKLSKNLHCLYLRGSKNG